MKGKVAPCLDWAISKMSKGQRIKLDCPSNWGLGNSTVNKFIPPNSNLDFDIELYNITD